VETRAFEGTGFTGWTFAGETDAAGRDFPTGAVKSREAGSIPKVPEATHLHMYSCPSTWRHLQSIVWPNAGNTNKTENTIRNTDYHLPAELYTLCQEAQHPASAPLPFGARGRSCTNPVVTSPMRRNPGCAREHSSSQKTMSSIPMSL